MVTKFVLFMLDGSRHGIPLAAAERVVPMVAVTPLPGSPPVVLGMISLHGEPVAVVDLRRRLGFPGREHGADSYLLISRTARRKVSIVVDEVLGVEEIDTDSIVKGDFVPSGPGPVAGVTTLPDGLVVVHDLEALIAPGEERFLQEALGAPA